MPATNLPKPVIGPITSRYGPRSPLPFHNGQDYGWLYADPEGSQKIFAPIGGKVLTGYHPEVGYFCTIPLGDGYSTRLCHFERLNVYTGQVVTRGQYLGKMGASGTAATGVHLHVDIFTPTGGRVDPAGFYTDTFVGSLSPAGDGGTPIGNDMPFDENDKRYIDGAALEVINRLGMQLTQVQKDLKDWISGEPGLYPNRNNSFVGVNRVLSQILNKPATDLTDEQIQQIAQAVVAALPASTVSLSPEQISEIARVVNDDLKNRL
jgi:murein DD-endopeptidase MepM/ murein hydrolase activator NlpD